MHLKWKICTPVLSSSVILSIGNPKYQLKHEKCRLNDFSGLQIWRPLSGAQASEQISVCNRGIQPRSQDCMPFYAWGLLYGPRNEVVLWCIGRNYGLTVHVLGEREWSHVNKLTNKKQFWFLLSGRWKRQFAHLLGRRSAASIMQLGQWIFFSSVQLVCVGCPKFQIVVNWWYEVNALEMKNLYSSFVFICNTFDWKPKISIKKKHEKCRLTILVDCKYICGPASFCLQPWHTYFWFAYWFIKMSKHIQAISSQRRI